MPLPTAPTTLKADAIVPNPGGSVGTSRIRASGNGSALFPTDGSVINLPGLYDVTQALLNMGTQRALITIEAAAGTTASVIARIWQDGKFPTTGSGLALYDGETFEINGLQNLLNARLISADGGAHIINVQYFEDLV